MVHVSPINLQWPWSIILLQDPFVFIFVVVRCSFACKIEIGLDFVEFPNPQQMLVFKICIVRIPPQLTSNLEAPLVLLDDGRAKFAILLFSLSLLSSSSCLAFSNRLNHEPHNPRAAADIYSRSGWQANLYRRLFF